MQLSDIEEYQQRLVQHLEDSGVSVSFGDDLSILLETYAAATGMDYVQLPFVLKKQQIADPFNFWVCFDDGNQPMALTGYRTLRNGNRRRRVGEAFSEGVLYPQDEGKKEAWWPDSGPMLVPGALYGYIGAGWVHQRFRGQNLAGFIARIAQAEAVLRTGGALAISTAMTTQELYGSGMNLRASGLHHLHVEQVLEGYFKVINRATNLYLSYSTAGELTDFYEAELAMLRDGDTIPWLHQHDKSSASAVLAAAAQRAAPVALAA